MIFPITTILLALVVLLVSFTLVAVFGSNNNSSEESVLVKDNTLKYTTETNGRNIKKSFPLTQINNYLKTHNEINIIYDYKLHKENIDKPCSANNLIIKDDKGNELSLRKLASTSIKKYNNICKFLDRIHDKDDLQLDFRLRKYVNQENNLIKIDENLNLLNYLYKNSKDEDIKNNINTTINNLKQSKEKIEDIEKDDQLRKLNEYYINMLIEIVNNYNSLQAHQTNLEEAIQTKNKIINSFELINPIFDTLYTKQENSFDKLEANINSLQELAIESNQLLKQQKQIYKD